MDVPLSTRVERIKKYDNREWPIRCTGCGELVDSRVGEYLEILEGGSSIKDTLDAMGVYNMCTRAAFMKPYTVIPNYDKIGGGVRRREQKFRGTGISDNFSSEHVVGTSKIELINEPVFIGKPMKNEDGETVDYSDNYNDQVYLQSSCMTYICHYND